MQKVIIVRGHSGSGKTTFAKQKMDNFCLVYADCHIFHIENDHHLMLNGKYYWTPQRFQLAKRKSQENLQQAFQFCVENPQKNILIIVSNVGVNILEIQKWLKQAENLRIQTEVYRLQNFFENEHQVARQTVYSMYLKLMDSPIENEVFVKPIMPMSAEIREDIEKLRISRRKNVSS